MSFCWDAPHNVKLGGEPQPCTKPYIKYHLFFSTSQLPILHLGKSSKTCWGGFTNVMISLYTFADSMTELWSWWYLCDHNFLVSGARITALVSCSQTERNRRYLKPWPKRSSLLWHELSMKEDWEIRNVKDLDLAPSNLSGIFVNLLRFTAGKGPKFEETPQTIPNIAKHTSAEMQNETLDRTKVVLKDTVQDTWVLLPDTWHYKGCSDCTKLVQCFMLLCWWQSHGETYGVAQLHGLTAEDIKQQNLKDLHKLGLDPQNTLCSCFDGAKVVSRC